jgi:hypothetical protein
VLILPAQMIKFIMVRILAKSSAGCHNSSNQKVFLKSQLGFRHCRAAMGFHYNGRDCCKDYASQVNLPGVLLKRVKKKKAVFRLTKTNLKSKASAAAEIFTGPGCSPIFGPDV